MTIATPDTGSVTHIPGENGEDPLVAEYLKTNKAKCAYHVFNWTWILLGSIAIVIGSCILTPLATSLQWIELEPAPSWVQPDSLVDFLHNNLGNPWLVALGMTIGALTISLLGRFIKPRGISAAHEPFMALPFWILVYLVLYDALMALSLLTAVLCLIYLGTMLFRLVALLVSKTPGLRQHELHQPDTGWPLYTVLVPLYKETAVASKILKNLAALDYPKDKLDVKFLLEADDPETLAAIEQAGIPSWGEVLVVPDAQPKTKPRACNHGLQYTRGEFLVIFDAEDRPEPDQLKQSVCTYQQCGDEVACLQAHLAYHNHRQNLLTKWFALEYNVWFSRYLEGLVRMGAPIPLGGTSNHFRTQVLHELGGWDPFNVTEDCDLGMRLHIAGYRTKVINSITWEEANSQVGNWIRQRSRWLKGYLITHFVWLRHPVQTLMTLGPWGTLCFFCCVFGVAGLAAINLPLWIVLAVYATTLFADMNGTSYNENGYGLWELLSSRDEIADRASWPMLYLGSDEDPFWRTMSIIFFAASAVLFFANGLFIAINAIFGRRQGQDGLLIPALLSPLYWLLIAIGAWKGIWQMLFKPHYWEKTVHGLDDTNSEQH